MVFGLENYVRIVKVLDRYKVYQGIRNLRAKFEKFTHQMKMVGVWQLMKMSCLEVMGLQHFIGKYIVTYNGHEVHNLNELEYINGEVWANVWQTNCIARISPKDAGNNGIDVLNGIAWDSAKRCILVKGKHWPKLYEIKLHRVKKKRE
ncbi:hypothetical protein ACB092_11G189100 [Castanea dentata]